MTNSSSLCRILSSFSIFCVLMLVSCAKEKSDTGTTADEEQVNVSKASSESEAEAETVFNGIFDDAMGVNNEVGMAGLGIFGLNAIGNTGSNDQNGRPDACFTVTVTHPNGTPFPARVLIDFGNTPCLGVDGHTRRGKIVIEYTNRLIIPGAVATTVFHDFYFDSTRVEGTHKISNTSTLSLPLNRQFKVEIINAKLTKPNGNYIDWNSTKINTQIEGLSTPDIPRDDVFQIEGSSHGRAKRGNLLVGWESNVVEPLIKRFLCRWIVKGSVKTVRGNAAANTLWVSILHFGNGNCDNQAVVVINGVAHQITLW
ncbi:MAG TPA: hypothetical protein VFZ42_14205 [Chitinophagaceae bacterium]